jgi:hypothetical protein
MVCKKSIISIKFKYISCYLKNINRTPYAAVSIFRLFRLSEVKTNPLIATIPGLIAKSSLAWPSLFIIFGNSDIRKNICFNIEPN